MNDAIGVMCIGILAMIAGLYYKDFRKELLALGFYIVLSAIAALFVIFVIAPN